MSYTTYGNDGGFYKKSKNTHENILSFINETDKEELINLGNIINFKNKGTLFLQGDEGECIYIIKSGSVFISTLSDDGQEVLIQTLYEGDIFGEIAVFDKEPRTASASAEKNTSLISIDGKKFLKFLNQKPYIYINIINLLCKRLRWSSKLVESFVFADSMERLLVRLIYLAEYHGKKNNAVIDISQDDLAKMLGLSREIVNKKLQELQTKKLLTLERKKITIHNIEDLITFNEGRE